MADRRCLHKMIVESDKFYKLPPNAQALYLHLTMAADDDGFLNCTESVASRISSGKSALQRLVAEGYLLRFGGVYVLTDFRVGNSLKNDRLRQPAYPEIAAKIFIGKNRAYSDTPIEGCPSLFAWKNHLDSKPDSKMDSKSDSEMESQKNRKEKNRTEGNRTEQNRSADGALASGFERLWSGYPEYRRGNPEQARADYLSQVHTEGEARAAEETLEAWKRSEQWNKSGGSFVPYLSNWLLRGLWRYPPAETGIPRGASGALGTAELEAIQTVLGDE